MYFALHCLVCCRLLSFAVVCCRLLASVVVCCGLLSSVVSCLRAPLHSVISGSQRVTKAHQGSPSSSPLSACLSPCADIFLLEPVIHAVMAAVDLFRVVGGNRDPVEAIMGQVKPMDRSLEPWVMSPDRPLALGAHTKKGKGPSKPEVPSSGPTSSSGAPGRRYSRRSSSSEPATQAPSSLPAPTFTPVVPQGGTHLDAPTSPTVGRV